MPLNDSFWNNEQGHLLAILKPRLEQMAFDAAKQAAQKAGIGFNPNLANANAARWARDYTDNLLKQLGTTSIAGIGEMIAQWVETPGATYGQLQQSLIHYGEIRAQAIAVTETTRAYAEGEIMAYKQEGITEIKWHTNRDEVTCKICGPLHGKVAKIGEEFGKDKKGNSIKNPPAHVSCRCWVTGKVSPNKERDAVFKPANPVGQFLYNDLDAGEKSRLAPLTGGNPIPFQLGTRSGNFIQDLLDLEKDNGLAKDETAYVFDRAGNPVLVLQGSPQKVKGLGSSMNSFTGMVVTHNHPAPGSFSLGDIKFVLDHKPEEFRASDHQYSYRIKIDTGLDFKTVEPVMTKHLSNLKIKYSSMVGLNSDEIEMGISHELWENISREFQQKGFIFEYDRKEW